VSKVIINVGARGTGKTTRTKKIRASLTARSSFIHDINNEYDTNFYLSENDFLQKANQLKGHLIIFEEASIFFRQGKNGRLLTELLVRSRHTENFIILNFHSLRAIPVYIFDFCDYILLGKTTENPKNVIEKFKDYPEIIEAYEKVNNNANIYFFEEISLR
jgi:hypothetical protein